MTDPVQDFAKALREFSEWCEQQRVRLEVELTPKQRERYDTLVKKRVPWMDALVQATEEPTS